MVSPGDVESHSTLIKLMWRKVEIFLYLRKFEKKSKSLKTVFGLQMFLWIAQKIKTEKLLACIFLNSKQFDQMLPCSPGPFIRSWEVSSDLSSLVTTVSEHMGWVRNVVLMNVYFGFGKPHGVRISGRGPDGQVREMQGSVYEQPKGEVDGSCHS
jgi:hypothetical protein